MSAYKTSALWKKTLDQQAGDDHEQERTRLRAAYEIFWERSVALAKTIANDLPGLTLHDDAHFSALWRRASELIGDNHDVNPIEAFVLGGAILLHDTGHAIKAYKGGRGEVEATDEYRDALVSLLRRSKEGERPTDDDIAHPDQTIAEAALFSALRVLHAKQAKSLLQRQFGDRYLLDDSDLRENLGEIIGQIAASHQDDRNNLPRVFPPAQNAPGYMPADWTIRPVYLACLLRCADAIQIDQTRAPPFLMGLQSPSGISRLHWLAQKKLGQPSVQPGKNGPGALMFTSLGSFPEAEADAWWVAYDLIQVANTELTSCNDLLLDEDLPGLAVDHVLDAERPDKLAKHVRTSGWAPINAEVRAADIKKIISLFGGHALYGRDPTVPLRELIQNAADAIRARRVLDKNDTFDGKIIVRLNRLENSPNWTLCVEDNGIGMSERVMRGPLIEFGTSFWDSDDASTEFSGLAALNLDQTGKYGIGFFSVLMISTHITITSKRYDRGYDDASTMTFRDGLKLRPLISKIGGSSLGSLSTRVQLEITPSDKEKILSVSLPPGNEVPISLRTIVAHLCCCLDCNVYVAVEHEKPVLAHSRSWSSDDPLPWLRDCTFADAWANDAMDHYLQRASALAKPILAPNGGAIGRAAIGFGPFMTGIGAIGRLVSGHYTLSFSESYIGVLAFEPQGPSRLSRTELVSPTQVAAWASEQGRLAAEMDFNDPERYLIAWNTALYGGDPLPVAMAWLNRNFLSVSDLLTRLESGSCLSFVLEKMSSGSAMRIGQIVHAEHPSVQIVIPRNELQFRGDCVERFRASHHEYGPYHLIDDSGDRDNHSLIGCLSRAAEGAGKSLITEFVDSFPVADYIGKASPRNGLNNGMELKMPVLRVSLSPKSSRAR